MDKVADGALADDDSLAMQAFADKVYFHKDLIEIQNNSSNNVFMSSKMVLYIKETDSFHLSSKFYGYRPLPTL